MTLLNLNQSVSTSEEFLVAMYEIKLFVIKWGTVKAIRISLITLLKVKVIFVTKIDKQERFVLNT